MSPLVMTLSVACEIVEKKTPAHIKMLIVDFY